MLSEQFVTATETSEKPVTSSISKDVGIHLHEFKPAYSLKSGFKKSSTPPNCLAVSSTHIFAAQSNKAVLHVYSRDRGNQEAVVPFPERIHSVEFVGSDGGAGVLALGTDGGRVILWEVHTGRQVTTPPSHLQEVTTLAADPARNILLSGSSDSKVHVWSMLALLSFTTPPTDYANSSSDRALLHTFSNHRAGITAILTGHSCSQSNIAVSTSKNSDCMMWDYHTGDLLRTFVLSAAPISLALDPCDRACYVGFEDGSIQLIDFFKTSSFHDTGLQEQALQVAPIQPPSSDHLLYPPESKSSPALCIAVVHEGNFIVSGHLDGQICAWDVATRNCVRLTNVYAPVTNVLMLPLSGLPAMTSSSLKLHQVIKPRYDSSYSKPKVTSTDVGSSTVPYNYAISAQFPSTLPHSAATKPSATTSLFSAALSNLSFPSSLLSYPSQDTNSSLQIDHSVSNNPALETENARLRSTVSALEEKQNAMWQKMVQLRSDKVRMEEAAEKRAKREWKAMESKRKRVQMKKETKKGRRKPDHGPKEDGSLQSDGSSVGSAPSSSDLNEDSSVQLTSSDEDMEDNSASVDRRGGEGEAANMNEMEENSG
ncbi:MAG: Pre-rRNA-processing protein ipi3 [Sclerophora amabilis]|nr:MAG: Pre-rRNA-processing protein ipi3 [Sclerophora amabilis]